MGQDSMSWGLRPGWRADELVELIRERAEEWWPKDLQLAVVAREDGDWMVVNGRAGGRSWEPELASSIARAVGRIRARNAWNGY